MDQRRIDLSGISTFLKSANESIDKFLADIGWDRNKLLEKCDNGTQPRVNIDDNESFPESFFDDKHQYSLKIDKHTQANIIQEVHHTETSESKEIPANHKDLITNFTREERLALYIYAVNATPNQKPLPELQLNFKNRDNLEKLTPLTEIAAYRRDIRRRNQKYRVAKNPLTYQEELRNLIQLQTEALTEYLAQSASLEETSMVEQSKSNKMKEDEYLRRSKDSKRKKHKRSRSRSRSGHRHKSKKSKRDDSRERNSSRRKHKSRH